MKGLILKDLLLIKNNSKNLILFIIVFGLIALQGNEMFYFLPAFISTMLSMSTFNYDDYNKWDAYAITLPTSRKNIVKSKYIANILLLLGAIIVTYILGIVVGLIQHNLDFYNMNSMIIGCLVALVLVQAIMYPTIFKLGVEKARIVLFVGIFIVSGIIGFLVKKININISSILNPSILNILKKYNIILIIILIICLLLISYIISKKIYQKKEF